jgi:8-oxo-dGTP pyrophosphatase MutT (NUDIX family)
MGVETAAARGQPVPARPAATVVVLRDGSAGLEVYLQRRTRTMGYAAGLWVFPGGAIDQADRDPAVDAVWAGPSPSAWGERLGHDLDQARGAVVAACRECLEEAGILLADRAPDAAALAAARQELLAGRRGLAGVLTGLGVRLDTARLRYWAWWVTPEPEPRRYDTRFFVAGLPAGAAATMHELEAERERWFPVTGSAPPPEPPDGPGSPGATAPLLEPPDGPGSPGATAPLLEPPDPLRMLPPTFCTLRELSAFRSVAEVFDAADGRVVERILPTHADNAVVLPSGERIPVPFRPSAASEPGARP